MIGFLPSAIAAHEPGTSVLFLGDTYFGESYQAKRADQGKENVLRTRGREALIKPFAGLLAGSELAIANLETAITARNVSPYAGVKLYIHRAEPGPTVALLKSHGIDAVSLANNHGLDYGAEGLADTIAVLDRAGISHCGAGRDAGRARRPLSLELPGSGGGRRLVVFCAFWISKVYLKVGGLYAAPGRAGAAPLKAAALARRIRNLRVDAPQTLIVVFPHWGWNYRLAVGVQQNIARTLIDAGADVIVGHGAHLFQEVERYRGRWILYGIGNFVFASEGRYAKFGMPPYSVIARFMIGGHDRAPDLRLYPIVTDNLLTDFHPRFVTESEFATWRRLLDRRAIGWLPDRLSKTGSDAHGRYVTLPFP